MTKTKSTKRALLMSALALLLCVSMFVGSTYAWFTDEVTSTNNKIVAGKLEIQLFTLTNSGWSEITNSSAPLFDENTLWEPGFTSAKVLKVKNNGNLALKWQAQFISDVELSDLADVIDVYVKVGADAIPQDRDLTGYTNVGTIREFVNTISTTTVGTLEAEEEATLGLILKMREEASNDYQGLSLGAFDIRIFATQLAFEDDSFGSDYDTNAPFGATASATMTAGQSTVLNFSASPSTVYSQTNIEVPADTYTDKLVEMTVEATNSLFNISADGAVVGSLDVTLKVDGVETSETLADGKVYTVTTYISKGLKNVSVSYTGTDGKAQPHLVSYDAATGELVFTTNHFSEYAVTGSALAYDKATDTAITEIKAVIESTTAVVPPVNTEIFAEKVEEAIDKGELKEENLNKDDIYPVKVGDTYFTSLSAALAEDYNGTVVLLKDITIDANNSITIAQGRTVIIDLNGKTLAGTSDIQGNAMITNRGTLTINDAHNTGSIEYTFVGAPDASYGKGNYTISNVGTLTLNGGSIINNTAKMSHAFYAIDNNSNSANATLTVNNGKILTPNNHSLRQIAGNGINTITINGGLIEGETRAIWVQLPGSNTAVAPVVNLTVNGGVLTGAKVDSTDNKLAIYSYSYGNDMKNVTINIDGGVFNGDVALTGGKNKTNIETVNVTGGTFNGRWGDLYSYGDTAKAAATITVKGGTFSDLEVLNYMGTDEFAEIKLAKDIELKKGVVINSGAKVTLDLNGKTISYEASAGESLIVNNGNLTIKGEGAIAVTFDGAIDNGKAINAISNRGILTVEGGTISNSGTGNQIGYAIDNYNGATLTVNGGKITASGSSYYDGIRLFCGSNETLVTVNKGEISSIWAQNPSAGKATPVKGTVVINGGIVNATYFENYTTVSVKNGVSASVSTYGAGTAADPVSANGYTVYSFAN